MNPHLRWHCCAVLAILALLPMWWPHASSALQWQRQALVDGQYWRLITAHLVHINLRHLLVNLLGLALINVLLWDRLTRLEGLSLILISALGVSMLLFIRAPALLWYAGLSGVLHGLWAACAGAAFLRRHESFYAGALLVLMAKLALEEYSLQPVSSIPIVSVAHLYGTLSGLGWLALRHGLRALRPACQRFRLKYMSAKERCDRDFPSARLGGSTLQPRSRYFLLKKRRA